MILPDFVLVSRRVYSGNPPRVDGEYRAVDFNLVLERKADGLRGTLSRGLPIDRRDARYHIVRIRNGRMVSVVGVSRAEAQQTRKSECDETEKNIFSIVHG